MFESLSRKLNRYYQVSFILIMASILGAIFYFWKLGFIDGSRGKELHKASFTFETLQEDHLTKNLNTLIKAQNYKAAIERIELYEKQANYVNSILVHDSYKKSVKEIGKVKEEIANLISTPKTAKVLSVFKEKMGKFNDFVKENNWRTLTRMSDRVVGLINSVSSSQDLKPTVKKIVSDFDEMEKITENSVLSRKDKSEIISRISNLKVEMNMLEKYNRLKGKLKQQMLNFKDAQLDWFENIGPELSMQKLQVERMGRYYLMGMLGALLLTTFFYLIGLMVSKRVNKTSQSQLEDMIEALVNEKIINQQEYDREDESVTETFKNYIAQTSDYVNKRMSFGTIFQEALPFSSIMLDKNLKVDWANKQFSEDWKITQEEITKDYMSWDYLNKLTNIGYDDPVLEALKHNVAGIYQIQVRPDQNSEVKPYEMFVSPVRYNNEKKIMLFFYPLTSIEQTIKDQAKSILNPIQKTIIHLKERTFDQVDLNQLRSEYEIGGIQNMLDPFIQLDEALEEDKKELTQKISTLYQEIEDLESIQDELMAMNAHAFRNSKGQIDYLKDFKKGVIDLSSTSKNLNGMGFGIYQDLKATFEDFERKALDLKTLSESYSEVIESVPNFDKVKDELKDSKTTTLEAKSKLAHDLSDLVHFKKKIASPEAIRKFQEIYNKIAHDFNLLDTNLVQLSKKIIQLEISLSKTQMLFNNAQKTVNGVDTKLDKNQLHNRAIELKNYETELRLKENAISEAEELIISSLQSIYKSFKTGIKYQSDMGNLINNNAKVADTTNPEEKTL